MAGSDPHTQCRGADAELKRRLELDGLAVDAGGHALFGVHRKR
jgi:hypothetical protein